MVPFADPTNLFIVQPAVVFLMFIVVWFIQSLAVLYISRRGIFPILYKFKITELLVAEAAIAIHELSHLIAAVLTGSAINLKESFLTSKEGRITAQREESVGGWISSLIAAFAPAFLSSFVFFIVIVVLTQVQLPFSGIFSLSQSGGDLYNATIFAASSILLPFLYSLASFLIQPTLVSVVLIYFIIILSITAGPSEGDWQAAMSILFSPIALLALFALLLIANYVFAQFDINILLPLITAVMLSISIVIIGLAVALVFSGVLYLIARALKRY